MLSLKSTLTASVLGSLLFVAAPVQAFNEHGASHSPNKAIEKILKGEHRSDKNKSRDVFRHPAETLSFFGFNNRMTVVEISPGGGWYTEILAPVLKDNGKFYAAFYPNNGDDSYFSKSRRSFEKKMSSNSIYSNVKITDFTPRKVNELAPKGSADLVLTFRNLHNWGDEGVKAVFTDAFNALKPGGVLGVVEHRLPKGVAPSKRNAGYYSPEVAIQLAKEAGFVLEASSEVNANPKDKADYDRGVWTLPPSYRLKDKDRAKYMAIGESDRMTLKFRKPR